MNKLRARALRNNMTHQEVKLWLQLKHFNARGFHFRRQAPIGPFIADFAEKTARLIIEVDGSQHGLDGEMARDARRDRYLAGLGYRVLRFWNADIDVAMDGVIDRLTEVLANSPHPPPFGRHPPRFARRDEIIGDRHV